MLRLKQLLLDGQSLLKQLFAAEAVPKAAPGSPKIGKCMGYSRVVRVVGLLIDGQGSLKALPEARESKS